MAFTVGLEGLLSSSDTGKDLYWLIQTSTCPYQCSIDVASESFDITCFDTTPPVAANTIKGMNSWGGSFTAKFPKASPASGHEGLVTFGNGYVLGCTSWSISATAQRHDNTGFATTPPAWKGNMSGLYSFSGSFDVKIDDTTALVLPSEGASTFRLSTDTVDNTLAGNIIITGMSPSVDVGGNNVNTYTFVVAGNLTAAGDAPFLEAGTLTRPETTAIVLRASGSRTYSGDAFLTGWTVGCSIGSPVEASVSFIGDGALAVG